MGIRGGRVLKKRMMKMKKGKIRFLCELLKCVLFFEKFDVGLFGDFALLGPL